MGLVAIIILVFISILTILYAYFKHSYAYWKSKGIPHDEPSIPHGNAKNYRKTIHHGHFLKNLYDKYKPTGAKYCGVYIYDNPVAVILDLDLVKNIMVKDFASFNDRGLYYNEVDDPISAHLFALDGEKWKTLRAKFTPTFTSGKMKIMFSAIVDVAERFRDCICHEIQQHDEVEVKELCSRFTTDVIGTCAFGITCNSLEDPNAEFRHYGRKIFTQQRHSATFSAFLLRFRELARAFHIKLFPDDISAFFLKAVHSTVEYREKNQVTRNDFMDILINLKNQDKERSITLNEVAAQAFVFFFAGFETSSTTLTYCLYELAINHEVQSKARQIILNALTENNGQFTYEMMMNLPYIDQIIEEALRKYPSLGTLHRRAKVDYRVPGTDKVINKGTAIFIPALAIHYDPEYYPNPDKFDPDRFDSEEKKKRDAMAWLAFGDGPRNCIGLRFGMMQVRVGLITLLRNFEFSAGKDTQIPARINPRSFVTLPQGGMNLKVKRINSHSHKII